MQLDIYLNEEFHEKISPLPPKERRVFVRGSEPIFGLKPSQISHFVLLSAFSIVHRWQLHSEGVSAKQSTLGVRSVSLGELTRMDTVPTYTMSFRDGTMVRVLICGCELCIGSFRWLEGIVHALKHLFFTENVIISTMSPRWGQGDWNVGVKTVTAKKKRDSKESQQDLVSEREQAASSHTADDDGSLGKSMKH